tara:strand:+ start:1470 stop:1997 length:528 start_codon:yes stop_codon:yes gene_type:complete
MKFKAKIKTVLYDGSINTFTVDYECPDFEVTENKFFLKNGESRTIITSVETQVDDWLCEQDKSEWMDDNDVGTIINFWQHIPKKRKKKISFRQYSSNLLSGQDQGFVDDFFATYAEIFESLKGKEVQDQFVSVLNAMSVGIKAATIAYQNMSKILKPDNPKQLIDSARFNDKKIF